MATPTAFPVKARKKEQPTRHGIAYVVEDAHGRVLVQDRPPRGLLGGTTELPGTAWTAEPAPPASGTVLGTVVHVFTHFRLDLVVARTSQPPPGTVREDARWVARPDLAREAFSTLMRNALALGAPAAPDPPSARPASRRGRKS